MSEEVDWRVEEAELEERIEFIAEAAEGVSMSLPSESKYSTAMSATSFPVLPFVLVCMCSRTHGGRAFMNCSFMMSSKVTVPALSLITDQS